MHRYCDKVVVRDLQTQETWKFPARRWLSLTQGDQTLYCTLQAQNYDNLKKLKNLEVKRLIKGSIKNEHPWAGMFSRLIIMLLA